ncbi:MAG TPA: gliding motility-associated C-terminal domain-containing protein [Saprospiraceae bacterium]|nr:gliding motility-associated C-terminal domain-containing protein [Saprospiraceae bacterium]
MQKNSFTSGILVLIFSICAAIVQAQPLQFLDYVRDSVDATEAHVEATEDGGWLQVSVAKDSVLRWIKFDYCGKIEWNTYFKLKGVLSQTSLLIADNLGFVVGIMQDSSAQSVFCARISAQDGTGTSQKQLYFDQYQYYSNPKMAVQNRVNYIAFNGGKTAADARMVVARTDNQFVATNSFAADTVIKMWDFVAGPNDDFYAAVGNSEMIHMDQNGKVNWMRNFKTNWSGMQNNLLYNKDIRAFYACGWVMDTVKNNLGLLQISEDGRLQAFSPLVPYDNAIKTKMVNAKGLIYVSHLDSNATGKNRKFLAHSVFNSNALAYETTKLNRMEDRAGKISSYDFSRVQLEPVFCSAGTIDSFKTLFNAKLGTFADLGCNDTSYKVSIVRPEFKVDSLTEIKFSLLSKANNISYQIYVVGNPVMIRKCEKFEFKDGEVNYPAACFKEPVQFSIGNFPNLNIVWSNGLTGATITVTTPAELSVKITYCDKTITQVHKVEVRDPNLPAIEYSDICPGEKINFTAKDQGYKFLGWEKTDSNKTISVTAPVTRKAYYECWGTELVQDHYTKLFDTQGQTKDYGTFCKGQTVNFNLGTFSRKLVFQKWSSGETTQSLNVTAPTERSAIFLCGTATVEQKHIASEILPNLSNENFDVSCDADSVIYLAKVDPYRSPLDRTVYSWSNGAKGIRTASKCAAPLTLSYSCKESKVDQLFVPNTDHCFQLMFPNVVSENAKDVDNTVFKPFIATDSMSVAPTFNMKVFNRWGHQVFETSKINSGWDLTHKGNRAAVDTYLYRAEATTRFCTSRKWNGSFTIIR